MQVAKGKAEKVVENMRGIARYHREIGWSGSKYRKDSINQIELGGGGSFTIVVFRCIKIFLKFSKVI